jgi:hypothetical protein
MIYLTAITEQLLPAHVRCTGSFNIKLVRQNLDGSTQPIMATLEVHREPKHVRCHLRAGIDFHTLTLPNVPPEGLAQQVKQWIEDCANGRLERAA